MRERKESEDKARKIRNIKRGMKGLGKSPIRAKKLNATRPGKKNATGAQDGSAVNGGISDTAHQRNEHAGCRARPT